MIGGSVSCLIRTEKVGALADNGPYGDPDTDGGASGKGQRPQKGWAAREQTRLGSQEPEHDGRNQDDQVPAKPKPGQASDQVQRSEHGDGHRIRNADGSTSA